MASATFKSLATATERDWQIIDAPDNAAAMTDALADNLMALLRMQASHPAYGWPVNVYEHCRQTATRAINDGADAETIVCALFHDATELFDLHDHGRSAALMLAPYISPANRWLLENHALFQDRHMTTNPHRFSLDYEAHRDHPAFEATLRFTTAWDQAAFDADYRSAPLEVFEPIVRQVLSRPRHG